MRQPSVSGLLRLCSHKHADVHTSGSFFFFFVRFRCRCECVCARMYGCVACSVSDTVYCIVLYVRVNVCLCYMCSSSFLDKIYFVFYTYTLYCGARAQSNTQSCIRYINTCILYMYNTHRIHPPIHQGLMNSSCKR